MKCNEVMGTSYFFTNVTVTGTSYFLTKGTVTVMRYIIFVASNALRHHISPMKLPLFLGGGNQIEKRN